MYKTKQYSKHIIEVLIDATFDPSLIQEFLQGQIEVCLRINHFFAEEDQLSLENLSEGKEYIQNEISLTHASMLNELLDINVQPNYSIHLKPSWEEVKQRIESIKEAFAEAHLDTQRIRDFLNTQLEMFQEIHSYNRKKFSKEELNKNLLKILNISLLIKALT